MCHRFKFLRARSMRDQAPRSGARVGGKSWSLGGCPGGAGNRNCGGATLLVGRADDIPPGGRGSGFVLGRRAGVDWPGRRRHPIGGPVKKRRQLQRPDIGSHRPVGLKQHRGNGWQEPRCGMWRTRGGCRARCRRCTMWFCHRGRRPLFRLWRDCCNNVDALGKPQDQGRLGRRQQPCPHLISCFRRQEARQIGEAEDDQ